MGSGGSGIRGGSVDCVLALLAAAAFVAFWRYRIGIIPIVLTCAAVGIIDTLAT